MKISTLIILSILLGSSAMYRIGAQAAQTDSARSEIAAQSASLTAALAQGDATKAQTDAVATLNTRAIDGGLPRDYATAMRRVRDTVFDDSSGLTTVFANDAAASTTGFSQQRYPEGAVIIMEFAEPRRDGEGELMRDAQGALIKGAIQHIDVMRRAAEWEYASYGPDGSVLVAPDKAGHCAACHRNAGASRDFVFRRRPWEVLAD